MRRLWVKFVSTFRLHRFWFTLELARTTDSQTPHNCAMNTMIFQHDSFRCDVDVFTKGDDLLVRFYLRSKEQDESEICDLVIVDPGFGILCLKSKGDAALLSGFLDELAFSEAAAVSAIEFVENLSSRYAGVSIPHHVRRFRVTSFIESNGEY